ncbi:MAG: hypothetical protein ACQKBU_05240, partial [Verrucomicrobiales bacterium]
MKKTLLLVVGLISFLPLSLNAENPQDLPAKTATEELRKELDQIRLDYEQRIGELEARIQELETHTTTNPPIQAAPNTPSPPLGSSRSSSQTSPAIPQRPLGPEPTTDEDLATDSNEEAWEAYDSFKETFRGDTETRT